MKLNRIIFIFSAIVCLTPATLIAEPGVEQNPSQNTTQHPSPISTLALDLNGNGIELNALEGPGAWPVYWDIDNDNFREASAWIKSSDGFLALDRNSNGKIDNQSELFSNGENIVDGFAALKILDSNNDNKISATDNDFTKLLVWRDLNHDGFSQSAELSTLAQNHIVHIDLNAQSADQLIAGNKVSAEANYSSSDGASRKIANVWFRYDNVNTSYDGYSELDVRSFLLPNLRGFGNLPDLVISMGTKPALLKKVQELAALDITANPEKLPDISRQILHSWANLENVDPLSRGGNGEIDARDIGFMETLFAKPATNPPNGFVAGPRGDAIEKIFRDTQLLMTSRLLFQRSNLPFFSKVPAFNIIQGTFTGPLQIDFSKIDEMMKGKTLDYVIMQWANIFALLEGSGNLATITPETLMALDKSIKVSDPSGWLNYVFINQIYKEPATQGAPAVKKIIETHKKEVRAKYLKIGGIAGTIILLTTGTAVLIFTHKRRKTIKDKSQLTKRQDRTLK